MCGGKAAKGTAPIQQGLPICSTLMIPLRRRIFYVAIVYFSFLTLLGILEVGTRLALPHLSSLGLFVGTSQQKAQVADAQHSTIFEGDPLLLWRLKPNLRHVVWDYTVVSTNAQHLRSDYPIGAKQKGTIRVVCLGDSVTFGFRVPVVWPDKPTEYDPEWLPYPSLLEKHLRAANPGRKVEVITMAVPGYTSHQGLAWLRRQIKTLEPDLLTINFGWNDVSLSDAPDHITVKTNWYAVTTRWVIDHSQAFAHMTKWLRSKTQETGVGRPVSRVSKQEYLDNFREMVEVGRRDRAGVIVIGAFYRDRVTNPPEAALMSSYREALRSDMQKLDVPFLEIAELMEKSYPANEGWFGESIHPNHMGHRLIASELLKLFATRALLKELTIPKLTP